MINIGDRVGAILGSDDSTIEFLGYGIYKGKEIPIEAVGLFAEAAIENKVVNPCILLDNGKKVYGCECWWGSEKEVKEIIETTKLKVINVDIEQVRKDWKKENHSM